MAYSVVGGGLSTYVPSTNDLATGALQVEFTRSVNSFPITRYAQIVPVTKMTGYYLRQDPNDNIRLQATVNEFAWPLGNDRPTGKQNAFDFVQYATQRFAFPFYIPQETAQQAAWDVVAQHARSKAQLAMTARTQRAATVLTTTGNWSSNYVANPTASPISATGYWNSSTASDGNIQHTIQAVMRQISLSTGGAVSPNQLIMVISPTVAHAISKSPEVREYVKNYPQALNFLQGSDTFARYGIPSTLFGLGDVVVDDSVKNTSKKGNSTQTNAFIYGESAVFLSRPGGLVGVEGATSFSTLQLFAYEDMTVEQFNDPMNRRVEGRVIDNSVPALVAPVSGYLIEDVLN